MHSRIRFPSQVFIGLQKNIEKSRQVFFAELRRRFRQCRPLVRRRCNQIRIRTANPRNQQIANMANRLAAKMLQVAAFLLKHVNQSQRAIRRACRNRVHQFVQCIFRNYSK